MEKRLYRNESDKMIAGVCSGLAEYFDIEVTWMRIIFVFAFIFGFSGFVIYIILWIVIPPRPYSAKYSPYTADYRVYEDRPNPPVGGTAQSATPMPPYMTKPQRQSSGNGRLIAGLILIGLGAYFLLDEFDIIPYWVDLGRLWPLAIIVLGLLLITRTAKKTEPNLDANTEAETTDYTSTTSTTVTPEGTETTSRTTTTSGNTSSTNENPEQPLS